MKGEFDELFDESLDREVNKWIVYENLQKRFGALCFTLKDALEDSQATMADLQLMLEEKLIVSEGEQYWLRDGEDFEDLERELREELR